MFQRHIFRNISSYFFRYCVIENQGSTHSKHVSVTRFKSFERLTNTVTRQLSLTVDYVFAKRERHFSLSSSEKSYGYKYTYDYDKFQAREFYLLPACNCENSCKIISPHARLAIPIADTNGSDPLCLHKKEERRLTAGNNSKLSNPPTRRRREGQGQPNKRQNKRKSPTTMRQGLTLPEDERYSPVDFGFSGESHKSAIFTRIGRKLSRAHLQALSEISFSLFQPAHDGRAGLFSSRLFSSLLYTLVLFAKRSFARAQCSLRTKRRAGRAPACLALSSLIIFFCFTQNPVLVISQTTGFPPENKPTSAHESTRIFAGCGVTRLNPPVHISPTSRSPHLARSAARRLDFRNESGAAAQSSASGGRSVRWGKRK